MKISVLWLQNAASYRLVTSTAEKDGNAIRWQRWAANSAHNIDVQSAAHYRSWKIQRSSACLHLTALSLHFLYFPRMGPGHPSFPLVHLFPHLFPFYFSLSFIGFTYFLLLSIPSLSTRIVILRFQAGGRRKRPNLGLVCCVWAICIP